MERRRCRAPPQSGRFSRVLQPPPGLEVAGWVPHRPRLSLIPSKGTGGARPPVLGLVQAQSQPLQPFPPFFSPPVSPSVAITHESNESLLFLLSADAASPATRFFFFFFIQSLCICTFKHLRCICPSSVFIFCSSFQEFGRKDGKIEDNRRREKPQTESVLTVVRSKLRPRYDSIRFPCGKQQV